MADNLFEAKLTLKFIASDLDEAQEALDFVVEEMPRDFPDIKEADWELIYPLDPKKVSFK